MRGCNVSEARRPRPLYPLLLGVGAVAIFVISYEGMTGCYTPSDYYVCMFDPGYEHLWLVALLTSIPFVLTVLAVRKATEINPLWRSGQHLAAREAEKASASWVTWTVLSIGPLWFASFLYT